MADDLTREYNNTVGAIIGRRMNVTSTETQIRGSAGTATGREFLDFYNDSSVTLYYGPTGVATSGNSKGMPLIVGEKVRIPANEFCKVYIIAASGINPIIVHEFTS